MVLDAPTLFQLAGIVNSSEFAGQLIDYDKMGVMKNIEKLAPWLSAFWLAITALVIYWNKDGTFNEVGDFVAGMMSALAFFWLVIGYYLQRQELSLQREQLKQNEEALLLQAQELKNQVQETKELVRQNARLADLREKEINLSQQEEEPLLIPIRIPRSYSTGLQSTTITFRNRGGDAINLKAYSEAARSTYIRPPSGGISRDEEGSIVIEHDEPLTNPVTVLFTYKNKFGTLKRISFLLDGNTKAEDLEDLFRTPESF